ncbi:putative zinc finger protein [Orchesella cincta]|uniref:Putative zinc finger protein n=1 Tax=Orchesella cincta TaxID=48709 RepID=A0A1D2MEZ0_ORCCI|nr:putative zinc finger protein [Orchesella cincta]
MGDNVQGPSSIQKQIKTERVFVKLECAETVPFLDTSRTDLKCDVRDGGLSVLDDVLDKDPLSLKQNDRNEELITGDLNQSDDEDDGGPSPPKLAKRLQNRKVRLADHDERKSTYKCKHCPFSSETSLHLKRHLPLHEKGSKSIICSECGWHVNPSKMVTHQKARHPPNETATANGIRLRELDTSNPNYVLHHGALFRRSIYRCRLCPFEAKDSKPVDTHAKVHVEGSKAVACKLCGIYVFPNKLGYHRGNICKRKLARESRQTETDSSATVPVVVNFSTSR